LGGFGSVGFGLWIFFFWVLGKGLMNRKRKVEREEGGEAVDGRLWFQGTFAKPSDGPLLFQKGSAARRRGRQKKRNGEGFTKKVRKENKEKKLKKREKKTQKSLRKAGAT